MLDEGNEQVSELLWLCVGDQFGDRWALADFVGIAAVRQEDGHAMLTDAAVIVRAGTHRVDDASLIEFDPYPIGLVLTAVDRCFETVATTCDLADGTVLVVLLSSVV
nr:hypothetical protein [Halomicroarcula rubra]